MSEIIDKIYEQYNKALEKKDYNKAIILAKELKEKYPKKTSYITLYTSAINLKEQQENKFTDKPIKIIKEKIEKGYDSNGELRLSLAKYLIDRKKYNEAEEYLIEGLNITKSIQNQSLIVYYIGIIGMEENNLTKAKGAFKKSIELCPEMVAAKLRLYEIAQKEENKEDAEKYFTQIITSENYQDTKELFFDNAVILSKKGNFELAKFRFACSTLKKDYKEKIKVMERLFLLKKYKELFEYINKENEPDFENIIKAYMAENEKDYKKFNSYLENIKNDNLKERIIKELIIGCKNNNEPQLKEYLIKYIKKTNSTNTGIINILAKEERASGKSKDALKSIDKAIELNPNNNHLLLEKVKILQLLNRYTEAKEIIDELRESNFQFAETELVKYYIIIGEYKLAKVLLNNIKNENNDIYIIEKEIELAIYEEEYEKANKMLNDLLNQDLSEAEKIILYQEKITLFMKQNKYNEALHYCNKLLEINKSYDTQKRILDVVYLIKNRLGIIEQPNTLSYFQKQVNDYNKEKTIEHIEEHLHENEYKTIHNTFDENIDPTKIYYDIKSRINKKAQHTSDLTVDTYIIELPYTVACLGNVKTNYVKVLTIINTDQIITAYPAIVKKAVKEKNKQR